MSFLLQARATCLWNLGEKAKAMLDLEAAIEAAEQAANPCLLEDVSCKIATCASDMIESSDQVVQRCHFHLTLLHLDAKRFDCAIEACTAAISTAAGGSPGWLHLVRAELRLLGPSPDRALVDADFKLAYSLQPRMVDK